MLVARSPERRLVGFSGVRRPPPSRFSRTMLRARLSDTAAARAVASLPTVVAVLLLVLNDHVLKGASIVPSSLTGKLSDFAFLFFAPIVLVYATRARSGPAVAVVFAAPAALFVAINVSPIASHWFESALSLVVPSSNVCDAEDLVALAILPLSWSYLWRPKPAPACAAPRASSRVLVTMIASIGCMATSRRAEPPVMAPTHHAVYMSWEELRSTAVQVKAPQPIGKRGKLLIVGDHLFLSEPGKGVHVFDNADPKLPRALMFIQVPGNIDIAVRGDLLYADSFVDLLVFELELAKRTAKLVERLEDQFDYDPYQTLTSDSQVLIDVVDRKRGVVIRLEPSTTEALQ